MAQVSMRKVAARMHRRQVNSAFQTWHLASVMLRDVHEALLREELERQAEAAKTSLASDDRREACLMINLVDARIRGVDVGVDGKPRRRTLHSLPTPPCLHVAVSPPVSLPLSTTALCLCA